jgi:hypothetical protein
MAHVFLSHSRRDRPIATQVVHALETYGLTVWWDWQIDGGERWRRTIAQRLQDCATIVVLWTPNSVVSDPVIEEASVGARRGVLVPLLMEPCTLPYGFGEINYISLANWDGGRHDPEFQRVVGSIQRLLNGANPILSVEERAEIADQRRRRAYTEYELTLRGESVRVFVGDVKDEEGISRARATSHLPSESNADYLSTILEMSLGERALDDVFAEHIRATPHGPVSTLEEWAQAIVDRATVSYRDQFNIG